MESTARMGKTKSGKTGFLDSKNTLQGSCTISRLVRNSTSAIQLLLAPGLRQSQSLIAEVVDVVVVVAVAIAVVLGVMVSPL